MDSLDATHKVSSGIKRNIVEASVMAVVQGLIPLKFSYRQDGMVAFADSLICDGQSVPLNTNVDIPYLLSSLPNVLNGVTKLSTTMRVEFKDYLPIILHIDGRMTCEGLKQDHNGIKYNDLIVHYIYVPNTETIEPIPVIHSRVFFLNGREGNESAANLRARSQ